MFNVASFSSEMRRFHPASHHAAAAAPPPRRLSPADATRYKRHPPLNLPAEAICLHEGPAASDATSASSHCRAARGGAGGRVGCVCVCREGLWERRGGEGWGGVGCFSGRKTHTLTRAQNVTPSARLSTGSGAKEPLYTQAQVIMTMLHHCQRSRS